MDNGSIKQGLTAAAAAGSFTSVIIEGSVTQGANYCSRFIANGKRHSSGLSTTTHGASQTSSLLSPPPETTLLIDTSNVHHTKKGLTAITLLGVLYANCIGSGYGFEDSVGSAGPLVTLVFSLLIPWIWCLPTGLAVSELATAVKSNSGVLMWVNVAFHPVVSFMCVLITVFITFVGNASYPNLFASYVENVIALEPWSRAGVKIACVTICALLNISGVELVGGASVLMSLFTLAPFVIFTVKQFVTQGINWSAVGHVDFAQIDWSTFLSITAWNFANLENAGAVVEEVANPRTSFLRAIVPLMFLTYVAYLLPVAAGVSALGASQDYALWKAGYWSHVASVICGEWLKYLLFAGAVVSGLGYTLTSLCCTSRLLAGMGTMDIFPHRVSAFMGRYHPKLKTPVNAIIVNSLITLVFSLSMSFTQVVALTLVLYCFRLIFVFGAVIRLRFEHPKLPRPCALPCGLWGCVLFLTPAIVFSAAVTIMAAQTSLGIGIATVAFFIVGPIVSFCYVRYFRPDGFEGIIVKYEDGKDPVADVLPSTDASPNVPTDTGEGVEAE